MHEIKENVKSALKTTSPKDILKKMKLTNANKIIIGHLNINSIRNKIEDLKVSYCRKYRYSLNFGNKT